VNCPFLKKHSLFLSCFFTCFLIIATYEMNFFWLIKVANFERFICAYWHFADLAYMKYL
jgi:hypothetical protein